MRTTCLLVPLLLVVFECHSLSIEKSACESSEPSLAMHRVEVNKRGQHQQGPATAEASNTHKLLMTSYIRVAFARPM